MTDIDLVSRVKELAKRESIPESELIIDELHSFLKEHKDHGSYNLIITYGPNNRVERISLECTAYDILHMEDCPHNNLDTIAELLNSVIYQRDRICMDDIELQKERREGKIGYRGHWEQYELSLKN